MGFLNKHLQMIDRRFDLVMITERFAESLVLLKRQLCWSYKDLSSPAVKNMNAKKKRVHEENVLQTLKKMLRKHYDLYNHFYQKFDRKVREFGQDKMKKELKLLKWHQKRV